MSDEKLANLLRKNLIKNILEFKRNIQLHQGNHQKTKTKVTILGHYCHHIRNWLGLKLGLNVVRLLSFYLYLLCRDKVRPQAVDLDTILKSK